MPPATETLRRTPLYDRHQAAGARLVPFAGWEMPVQYEGIRQEHVVVRTGAGMFDVSHMGEIETSGPQAEAYLQHLLSNDVRRMPEGGMFIMADVRRTGLSGDEFALGLLNQENIATMPGESFGRAGHGHVRISLTANEDDVAEACKRIVRYARRHPDGRRGRTKVALVDVADAHDSTSAVIASCSSAALNGSPRTRL